MDDELLHEFIAETREHLYTIETDLLTIEENGENVDQELINKVFRAAHSIKGGSGFFGLEKIKELSHRAETVLDMMRAGKIIPNPEITNLLLAAFDQLREMINMPGASEEADIAHLLIALNDMADSYLSGEQKGALTRQALLTGEASARQVALPLTDVERSVRTGQSIYRVQYDLIHDIEARKISILELFNSLCEQGEILDCALDFQAIGTLDDEIGTHMPLLLVYAIDRSLADAARILRVAPERIEILIRSDLPAQNPAPPVPVTEIADSGEQPAVLLAPAEVAEAQPSPLRNEPPAAALTVAGSAISATEETLRVSVPLLENLMNLAGELVLGRNQLRAAIARNNPQALKLADQRLNQVTSELQDAIMKTRLQPIGHVFGKYPRVVRDMAKSLDKEIAVDIQGKEVELDRSLLEGLSDPLTHMIRNAADHGLETTRERRQAGKPAVGRLRISARHEAGQVVVEIADDGRGIDPEKIALSALKKGQVNAEKLAGMSAQEKLELIMMPGFSTAAQVSEFSGRGVGMDVVKTNINKLGGQVEITSEIGHGTTFRIKLPLTLAIIPSLIIELAQERFAIPQINVEELLRIRAEDVKRRIEVVGGVEVLLLRDNTLPLVRFDRFLGVVPTYIDPQTGRQEVDRRTALADRRSLHHPAPAQTRRTDQDSAPAERSDGRRCSAGSALEIVVINSGTLRYGLVVGGFRDTEEIVVKPLGRHLKRLTEYAGATILGDGTVALIIDAAGLAHKAELASVSASARALELLAEAERKRLEDRHSLLLFHNAPDENCAVFLEHVVRIERISRTQLETFGGRRTMHYRGGSLPLVSLADTAQVNAFDERQELVVIVSRVHEREVGLLAAMPVDVVESSAHIDDGTHRQPGIVGSTVIDGATVMVADIREMATLAYPEWTRQRSSFAPALADSVADTAAASGTALNPVVLLAEDSDFFRSQVTRYLQEEGCAVLAAADGEAAWNLLLEHLGRVNVVVTDIEMPRLNGLELAKRIRSDGRTAGLPIIAVSSLAGEDDRQRGRAAGIDDYQVKLDRDALTSAIQRLLG